MTRIYINTAVQPYYILNVKHNAKSPTLVKLLWFWNCKITLICDPYYTRGSKKGFRWKIGATRQTKKNAVDWRKGKEDFSLYVFDCERWWTFETSAFQVSYRKRWPRDLQYVLRKKKMTDLSEWRLMISTIFVVLRKMKLWSDSDSILENGRQVKQMKRISPNWKH